MDLLAKHQIMWEIVDIELRQLDSIMCLCNVCIIILDTTFVKYTLSCDCAIPGCFRVFRATAFTEEDINYILSFGIKNVPAILMMHQQSIARVQYEMKLSTELCGMYKALANSNNPRKAQKLTLPKIGAIYVSGDRASVGKSTICLSLLASLCSKKYYNVLPDEIAYIKPITQCEEETEVTRFCQSMGIECIPIGPVVFYRGFTRAFLRGETDSTVAYLAQIRSLIDGLMSTKRLVIVDGVGYPSVGSICGLSNSDVCHSVVTGHQNLPLPVLLVGKPGIGDAIDSYNINCR